MKLLFAIKALHDISGGAERVLADVTGALVQQGHEVIVLTYDIEGQAPFYPLSPNVRLINLALGNPKQKSKTGETLKRMAMLRKTVIHEKPDVVVGFMHSMFVPAAFALIGIGIPLIASEHIVPAHYRGKPLESFLLLLASIFTSRYTVLSEAVKRSYPKFLHAKMTAIANPVTMPAQIEAKAPREHKLLLGVGRLEPQKDFATLIAAFGLLAPQHPDWSLRIVGEGSLRDSLQRQIAHLKLQDRIDLPGRTHDVETHYKDADIFVLPSLYESFGLAAAEALAYGVPVVAFADCAGLNELIVPDTNGLLVAPGVNRAQSLATALDGLMSDAVRREALARQAPASIAGFSLPAVASRWDAMLRQYS